MRVPLLDLSEQYRPLTDAIRREVDEIIASQQFILGPKGAEFEKTLSAYCRANHAIGISSGTDALLAILMALGIGSGDAVLMPSFTFFATGGCVARVGATPVFLDIDPATYNLSVDAVEKYVAAATRGSNGLTNAKGERIRAIIPVHLFGQCCDMQPLMDLARREKLLVIEDAAQAIGAECVVDGGTRQAGTIGDAGSLSFYPTKNLGAAGDAGAVLTDDDDLAERVRICRQHGMEERYFHKTIGGNFRLDEIQAAILKVKLPYLDRWTAARVAAATRYRELFAAAGLAERVGLPIALHGSVRRPHIYHQFVIRTPRRDALREHLMKREVGTAIYYPLGLHQQECFAYVGYREGDLPETERAARETLALPIFPEITAVQQEYVVGAIAEFFQ